MSLVTIIVLVDTRFHLGFDKLSNPLWTIIPTNDVINDISEFHDTAYYRTVEERKEMYDKVSTP
jgi:hypothetical protein